MKFTIDTKEKTIIIKEVILIEDLLKELTLLNIDYSEYKLFPYVESYSYPVFPYIERYDYPVFPNYDVTNDPHRIILRHPDDNLMR